MRNAAQLPALLLVHGAWHGAWCWEDEFAPYLRGLGLDVFSMNLPGHGQAGAEKIAWYSIADYVEAVAAELRKLNRPTVVLGHSMGGYVAQKLMERNPKNLAGVVLFAAATQRGVLRVVGSMLAKHPLDFLVANVKQSLYHLVRTPERARALFHSAAMSREDLQRHWQRIGNESYRAFLDMLLLAPMRSRRRQQALPVLVLGGEQDVVFPPNVVEACAKSFGVNATIYQAMPHCLQQDANWRQVANDVFAWMQRGDG